jgi:hypothetical protein
MQLPFSRTEFFDVFAAYNVALWPAALLLWLASLAALIALARSSPPPHRALSGLLAIHWGWSAAAYHAAFFSRINAAAWLFAGVFLVQAALFAWFGAARGHLWFSTGRSARHIAAAVLAAYALAYPLVNAALGHSFPRAPTFGVPCPTTIFTIGLLLTADTLPWWLAVVPILWSLIAGSAAVFLGVRADFALPVAAALLILFMAAPRHRTHRPVVHSFWRRRGGWRDSRAAGVRP